MTMIKTNESGRSMIEMLGVLAIIGVLSVGGIAGYSKAMNKFKTNKVADNVSMIVANIKTIYAQQNSYKDLTKGYAVDLGTVPDELVASKTAGTDGAASTVTLTNAYNGSVDINASNSVGATTTANTGDSLAFTIVFNGLSKEACITLATNDWGSGYSSGLIAIQAAATAQTIASDTNMTMGCTGDATSHTACPGGSTSAVPMDVTEAATACACNTGNTCSVMWKYY